MEISINKIAAGVVGLAMIAGLGFAFTATQAHALTLSELVELFIALEVIPADKADEARTVITNDTTTTTDTAGAVACTGTFARNLTVGDTGADVKELQMLLNSRGFTVATAGAVGSAGMETEYFGPATKSAVTAMQNAYAGEILAPLGLTMGTGFFGASTRAKANTLCSATTPTTPTTPGDEDTTTDTKVNDLSGEASLSTFEMNSADDDEIDEGQNEAAIGELKLEFSDGDAMITRLDVSLVGTSVDEKDPYDVFDTLYLMVDGDVVAEKDISSKSDYLDDKDGSVRFTGLDIVGMEDEELVITIAADVANSVDGAGSNQNWTLTADSMRFVDGTDVTSTEDLGVDTTFTIAEKGGMDELLVKTSSSDPDSSIIKVDRDTKSDWITVFVFDLDTNDSENDITLNTIPVAVTTSLAYSTLVDDARLVIDGTTVDSSLSDIETYSTATETTIVFDADGDVVIDAGDRVKAELQLRFKSLSETNEALSPTVQGFASSTMVDMIDAEGADDLSGSQLDGSATGDTHNLMTTGIFAELVSVTETGRSNGTDDDTVGEFKFKFDVTAFEDTYYVQSAASTTVVTYKLNGVATTGPATILSSTADKDGSSYRIDEGDTETFTYTVTTEPGAAGYYNVSITAIQYGDAVATPWGMSHTFSPADDFESDDLYLNA